MGSIRVDELARRLAPVNDYGPERSRLALRVLRALAAGAPVGREHIGRIIAGIDLAPGDAESFLRQVAERDSGDDVIGIMGLSLGAAHPHRFVVDGRRMSTWCAFDTLFLPALLERTARVESHSPLSREVVRLTVSPERIEQASPAGAVMSMVTTGPGRRDLRSVQALWSAFCCHVHFFASSEEAERWAASRDDIAVLSMEEGFELGQAWWPRALLAGR